jgi:hypothetical protein
MVFLGLAGASGLDWRVVKGSGTRGYNSVRVSIVTDSAAAPEKPWPFEFSSDFEYRWKYLKLHSTLLEDVKPGSDIEVRAGTETLKVSLPKPTDGLRAVIFGDPCSSNIFKFPEKHPHACWPGLQSKMGSRMPQLLNLAAPDIDAFGILGDNFYDRNGSITTAFFKLLTPELKRKFFFSVIGNHDYWVGGTPNQQGPLDQFGNGFMQYYAHDTLASLSPKPPPSAGAADAPAANFFDFRGDPDVIDPSGNHTLPAAANFLWHHQLGNVGLIGFSGAYSINETAPYLAAACKSFGAAPAGTRPRTIYLVGHWTKSGASGCAPEMGTPDVFARVVTMPGCDGGNVRFLMGHEHCNKVWNKDVVRFVEDPDGLHFPTTAKSTADASPRGFLVGASGAGWSASDPSPRNNPCPEIGFVYLDTTGGREAITLFTVWNATADNATSDYFEPLRDCFEAHGIGGCTHLGTRWLDVPLPDAAADKAVADSVVDEPGEGAASSMCSFSYATQHSYPSLNLSAHGIGTRNVFYINGDALGSGGTVGTFTDMSEMAVESRLRHYVRTYPIDGGADETTNFIVLDIETPVALLPTLSNWLDGGDKATFDAVVAAFKMRLSVAHRVFPQSHGIGIYGSPIQPGKHAGEVGPDYDRAVGGLATAAAQGMLDKADFLLPVLYFGANESAANHQREVFGGTNATMTAASSIRKSDGKPMPIFASTKFFYGHSLHDGWGGFVECDTNKRLVALLRRTPTLARIVWWDYPEGYVDMPTPEQVKVWFDECEPVPADCRPA